MSPIGGVDINLAVQDAVAAARLLAGPLRDGTLDTAAPRGLRQRRERPVKVAQRAQIGLRDRLIASTGTVRMPWFLKVVGRIALLLRIPAWFIGVGVRPGHIR
jgi:2-polyprenyl-6-methoxyphenol hydroxylase-like FAD-dependent oxidoreductase